MSRGAQDWRMDGEAHYRAQRWSDAAQAFEKTLALEPDCVEIRYLLGNAYQELGHDVRAIECFEQVVAREPAHAKAWNNMGTSRQRLGQEVPAVEAYRHAVEIDPSLTPAVLNLAHASLHRGEDEGAARLFELAASIDPSNPGTWDALARVQFKLGRTAAAEATYRTAMGLLSPHVVPHIKEAERAIGRGDYAAAAAPLAAALEHLPGNLALSHMLAAVRGQTTDRAPGAYVSAMYDDFAQQFDQVLRENLGYRVPEQLAEFIAPMLQRAIPAEVIDLGCGTGLLGAALAPLRANILGIDLSEKMLERARLRGTYARLIRGDLVEELGRVPAATVDAVLATDVFIYLGDLQPVFAAAARALVPGGLFAFSVEAFDEGDFTLRPYGRYAHSCGYIRSLAAQMHFAECRMQRIRLRRERDRFTEGWLACFVAPGGESQDHAGRRS
jgi:predicted TPR repeat methyltransferase